MKILNIAITVALLAGQCCLAADDAEAPSVKESVKSAGKEVGKVAHDGVKATGAVLTDVGHFFRDTTKDIGNSVRDGWKESDKKTEKSATMS